MKREELEEKIKEERTIEANKKGLVGQGGKIGTVLRVFGQPIILQSEGGSLIDSSYIDLRGDKLEEEIRNNIDLLKSIPVMDLDSIERPSTDEWTEINESTPYTTQTIGWHFDGLSRGMHLEIKYEESKSELIVLYKGYLVYKEMAGDLLCYVPVPEWEDWIERLSKSAKDIQRKIKEKEFAEQVKKVEEQKQSWWDSMKSRWGVS